VYAAEILLAACSPERLMAIEFEKARLGIPANEELPHAKNQKP